MSTPRTGMSYWTAPLAVILVLALAAGPAPSVRGQQQTEIVLRLGDDLLTMDPATMTSGADYAVAYVVYSGLVRQNPGSTEVLPDLATRWEMSPDGLTYTFFLRRGVKWHKGFGELTAEDVKYSFERIMAPGSGSRFRTDFEPVRAVTVVDPHTVRITMDKPYPAFLSAVLAYRPGYIVNRRAIERFGREYISNVVGTGPYVFERWIPGQAIVVAANPDYYGPMPAIQRATFRIIREDATAEIALEKGDIHLAYFDEPEVMARVARNRRLVSKSIAGPRTYWVHFNMTRPPFNDVRVRQALNYATNKDDLVKHVFLGQAEAADTPLNRHMFGFLAEHRYSYNPERARELLAEAGFRGGIRGRTFEFVINAGADWEQMAAVLQRQWKAVGVETEIKVLERSLFEQRRRGHQFDLLGINALRLEPDQILVPYFHSSQIPFPNVSSYRGADALIEGAREQVDPTKRRQFYEAAQKKIQADAPIIPLLRPNILLAYRPDVRGAEPGLLVYKLEAITLQQGR